MGHDAITRVDVAALRVAADQFDTGADILESGIRTQLARLAFDGARAGRDHVADGDALRHRLDRLVGELTAWSRASTEIAGALRVGAQRYADAEVSGATRIA